MKGYVMSAMRLLLGWPQGQVQPGDPKASLLGTECLADGCFSEVQLLPFRDSLAIEGDLQGSQPNQKRELQRAVGAQRSGRQEEISPRREALVGLSGWLVALGLCRCTRASSLVVARRGSSLIAAHRLLIAVASLVAEHRL